jgi:hypothetical protein
MQIVDNIPENMMRELSRIFIEHQKPGGRTILQRILRDQFLGQIKVKV